MVVIYVLVGILIFSAFTFLLIEYPYYLVSVFLFLHLYEVNLDLPGPLDLRGLISVALFMRIVIFDKNNFNSIIGITSNGFYILILLFTIYTGLVYFLTGSSILFVFKFLVLNLIGLWLGFITVHRGYGMKTIVLTFLITGIVSTTDLVYSYFSKGKLRIVRIIDLLTGFNHTFNHNFFGSVCAHALIIAVLLIIYKRIPKKIFYALLIIYSLGILVSTSRMTILTVTVTLLLILITQNEFKINFKKVFNFAFTGVILFVIVFISYAYILSSMNISSKFADQIYWRLVEEPMSFFGEDVQHFSPQGQEVEGSIRWRINQTFRDADVFLHQKSSTVLFGFGYGGHEKIGLVQFKPGTRESYQYAAHNFYTDLVSETGLTGLFLFYLFFLPILYYGIKMIKQGKLHFSLIIIILFMFIDTIGSVPDLTGKVTYILYGCIIAEFVLLKQSRQSKSQNKLIEDNIEIQTY